MDILRYKNFFDNKLNENLGYRTIFGKEVSHNDALKDRIRSLITEIVREERKISEKSFNQYDKIISEVKELCDNNLDIYNIAEKYYQEGKRLSLLAEEVYDKYLKNK